MAQTLYTINKNGQGSGGFLCPPGHPNHEYVTHGYYGGRRKAEPDLIASIEYLIANEYGDVPESVRARAVQIMASAELTCSERWVRSVYGYFRNSYSPDGRDRNVSHSVSSSKVHCVCGAESLNMRGLEYHLIRAGDGHHQVFPPVPPAEHHLGYLCVREYFPEHAPRLDLIENPSKGYGSYPCVKCGERVQYEARADALCVVKSGMRWEYNPDCPKGGQHEIKES